MSEQADQNANRYNLIKTLTEDIFQIGVDEDLNELRTMAMALHEINDGKDIDKMEWYMKWRKNRDITSSPEKYID